MINKMHVSDLRNALAAAIALAFLIPVAAAAQTDTGAAPQTPWGTPDLQGVWDFRTITPMERPEERADQSFLTEEEVANLEQEATSRNERLLNRQALRTEVGASVDSGEEGAPGAYNNFWLDRGTRVIGTRRTSLITDPPNGRIPPRTPDGERRLEAYLEAGSERGTERGQADSWEDLNIYTRCILGFNAGPPMEPHAYNNHMQLFQTPNYVVIFNEMVHDARIIPVSADGNVPDTIHQWKGTSRGHWEGDTFVVETTNLYGLNSFTGRNAATQDMHIIERFTRTDSETLSYQFTVEDPATWTRPWTAEIPMARSDDQLWEFACHEGNYGIEGILAGHRAQEREAAR